MRIPRNVRDGFASWSSESESKRFGRSVRRYILVGDDSEPMVGAIETDGPELAVVRVPTDRLDVVAGVFERFRKVLLADCLVVYRRDNFRLATPDRLSQPRPLSIEEYAGGEGDLLSLLAKAFEGYRNHYSINPTIRRADVVSGYQEWVSTFFNVPNRKVLMARWRGEAAGFLALESFQDEGQIVLNGVRPDYQGRGVYRGLVQEALRDFTASGLPHTVVSTQIDNLTVQRVWVSEGFLLSRSYFTLHVMQEPARSTTS